MEQTILAAVGGILSYFLGSFGSDKLFNPGFDEPYAGWKILFAFLSAAAVFASQSKRGLTAVILIGIAGGVGLGLNYKSQNAIPPWLSASATSWFFYQLTQSCFVGVGLQLLGKLKNLLPKKDGDGDGDNDSSGGS